MRRRIILILMFVLAGAVVNVAVAWGIALGVNPYGRPLANEFHALNRTTLFKVAQITAFGTMSYSCRRNPGPRGGRDFPTMHDALPRWASRHQIYSAAGNTIIGSGWPLPVFSASIHSVGHGSFDYEVFGGIETPLEPFAYGGIKLPKGRRLPPGLGLPGSAMPRVVPLRPIWLGFAVNTIFYAALLWVLIPGPFALRRLIRIRRGLCPACAYPRGQLEMCSECGEVLPSSRRHIIVQ